MAKSELREFQVYADLRLCVSLKTKVKTLEDALVVARSLNLKDWLSAAGDPVKAEVSVVGVME